MKNKIITAVFLLLAGSVQLKAQTSSVVTATMGSMRTSLYQVNSNGTTTLADGNLTNFHDIFNNAVCEDDAIKLNNFGENFGILRSGSRLAVEQRRFIGTRSDTCQFIMWNMQARDYRLVMTALRLTQPNVRAYFEDRYSLERLPLNLEGAMSYDFTVDANPASYAQDRFRIVYEVRRKSANPIIVQNIRIVPTARGNQLTFSAEDEQDVALYQVEISENGGPFVHRYTITPYGSSDRVDYQLLQEGQSGTNFRYRIKTHFKDGRVEDSPVELRRN